MVGGSPLRRAVKLAALSADRLRPPPSGLVILIYHRVGGRQASEIDLPVPAFDEQMAELAATGAVGTLDDGLAWLRGPGTGRPPVAVTFDDGTADFVDDVVPVLVRHQVPALLYVATDFIESQRSFPGDGRPVSWSGLADALSTGLVEIGSHTHRHALLDRAAPGDIADELDRSTELIAERLGVQARHFAYPKAVAGSALADSMVRERFASAALAGNRANVAGATDPWALARTPVQTSDGTRFFRQKVAGGMGLEDALRRRLNKRRYAGATT